MQITGIRIRRVGGDGKTRALASITLDEEFMVHELRIVDGANGLFVAMPSRKNTRGEYHDIAHAVSARMRAQIQEAVLAEYAQTAAAPAGGVLHNFGSAP